MLRSSPSGCHEVYGVSHQVQRKLQPLVRTKTDGTPANVPSPWMEWKISEIFKCVTRPERILEDLSSRLPRNPSGAGGTHRTSRTTGRVYPDRSNCASRRS